MKFAIMTVAATLAAVASHSPSADARAAGTILNSDAARTVAAETWQVLKSKINPGVGQVNPQGFILVIVRNPATMQVLIGFSLPRGSFDQLLKSRRVAAAELRASLR
jgi:hypothetical protein